MWLLERKRAAVYGKPWEDNGAAAAGRMARDSQDSAGRPQTKQRLNHKRSESGPR